MLDLTSDSGITLEKKEKKLTRIMRLLALLCLIDSCCDNFAVVVL